MNPMNTIIKKIDKNEIDENLKLFKVDRFDK